MIGSAPWLHKRARATRSEETRAAGFAGPVARIPRGRPAERTDTTRNLTYQI